jgi:hypothetical protein
MRLPRSKELDEDKFGWVDGRIEVVQGEVDNVGGIISENGRETCEQERGDDCEPHAGSDGGGEVWVFVRWQTHWLIKF